MMPRATHFGVAITAVLILWACLIDIPLNLTADGSAYLHIADTLQNGTYFNDIATAERTPLYPILLSLGSLVTGDEALGILLAHLSALLVTLLVLIVRLRISSIAAVAAMALCTIILYDSLTAVLTEWLAACLLIVLWAELSKIQQQKPSDHALCISVTLASLLILLHPLWIITIPCIAFLYRKHLFASKSNLFAALCGLLPLLCWLSIQMIRLDSPRLIRSNEKNLFGIATLIGTPEMNNDGDDYSAFISKVSSYRTPKSGEELMAISRYAEHYRDVVTDFNYNVSSTSARIAPHYLKQWDIYRAHLSRYAYETIMRYPERYLAIVWLSLQQFLPSLPFVILCILTVSRINRNDQVHLAIQRATRCMVTMYIVHMIVAALLVPITPRFIAVMDGVLMAITTVIFLLRSRKIPSAQL